MSRDSSVVRVEKLSHYFGEGDSRRQVLFDNTVVLEPGEIAILTGPSGSGKTTLLTLTGGLRSVQEGSARVLGRELKGLDTRSLVQVRISQINGCAHCIDLNSSVGLERGLSEEKLNALPKYAETALFDEREKAALDYAEAITDSNRRTDPTLIARLRQHFSDDEIIELTALIAFQNMSSKFNAALGVEAQGFCTIGKN